MTKRAKADLNRRSFLGAGAAGAVAAGLGATDAAAQSVPTQWDQTADVVVIGAGVAGLPAAITARELGASVIVVEENYDIGRQTRRKVGARPGRALRFGQRQSQTRLSLLAPTSNASSRTPRVQAIYDPYGSGC